ncbi:hypothetical protein QCA50_020666 [Cerrena zonata]|uniref:Uncharacterized protein n=1 Tax=Cerrena zonata TaxID=2478898 RepID=A0AAW0FGJ1_9APHY
MKWNVTGTVFEPSSAQFKRIQDEPVMISIRSDRLSSQWLHVELLLPDLAVITSSNNKGFHFHCLLSLLPVSMTPLSSSTNALLASFRSSHSSGPPTIVLTLTLVPFAILAFPL